MSVGKNIKTCFLKSENDVNTSFRTPSLLKTRSHHTDWTDSDLSTQLHQRCWNPRCKKRFLRFFILGTFFTILTFFYFPNGFYFKNVGKVHSSKQINKKHFQRNRPMIFLLHVKWPEMPPYKLLLTCYVRRIVWRPWGHFLCIRRGVELH